ncbi:CNDD3 protein, partial [Turnix velox]|nr:CNDD3 protein [Turnix velox]
WVSTVWDQNFLEVEPLAAKVAQEITQDGPNAFSRLYQALSPFAGKIQENTENIGTFFSKNNLSPTTMVAVLHHFVQEGQQKKADAQQRICALHAAGLYFLLLEVPGTFASRLFHEVMFEKCLHTLTKCWPQNPDVTRKKKKMPSQSSKTKAQRGRKKGRPNRIDSEMEEEEEEEDEDRENIYISTNDLVQIRDSIFLLLKNFLRLLLKFSLKEKPQCMQSCLKAFVELTNFDAEVQEFEFPAAMDVDKAKYIPELAYHGLGLLCSPLHGTKDEHVRYVFRPILHIILMVESSMRPRCAVLPITSAVLTARKQAIKFVSFVVDELKEVGFSVLRILLQNMCAKVPDKAEYRTYAAQALGILLNKLPNREFADFIRWLYKYSLNSKSAYRVFAIDAALALLDVPERNWDHSLSLEHQKFLKHKFLVQIMVFGRCWDKASVVRSKALSSFAQCLEIKDASILDSM